jgi:hypothetical protein
MSKQKPHYVNNKEFSQAVVDYVKSVEDAEERGKEPPKVTNYIADCFLKIAEGLSHRPNFIRYTYREEMVMDAVENCLKAIMNYNIEAATRTGNPNAFAYFTQICYYAFIRRIQKEKKQFDVKIKFIEQSGFDEFMTHMEGDDSHHTSEQMFVDQLKDRIDKVKEHDRMLKEFTKQEKEKPKKGIELFMG